MRHRGLEVAVRSCKKLLQKVVDEQGGVRVNDESIVLACDVLWYDLFPVIIILYSVSVPEFRLIALPNLIVFFLIPWSDIKTSQRAVCMTSQETLKRKNTLISLGFHAV